MPSSKAKSGVASSAISTSSSHPGLLLRSKVTNLRCNDAESSVASFRSSSLGRFELSK